MVSLEGLAIEPLCVHHDLRTFDCGEAERNLAARNLAVRLRALDNYDFSAIVAVVPQLGVVGIAAVFDVVLEDRDEDGEEVSGRCLYYSLLAADVRVRPETTVVQRLLHELATVRDHIYRRSRDYIAEVADPLDDRSLTHWLRHNGFRPIPPAWYRPRRLVDPTWSPP